MNMQETICILEELRTIFKDVANTPQAVDTWAKLLEPYDSKAVKRAVVEALETCKYTPKPADIIQLAKKYQPSQKTQESISLEDSIKEKLAQGYILTTTGYAPKEDVITYEGTAYTKIEFVMKVLSPKTTTAMLRDELKLDGSNPYGRIDTKKYRKFLDEVLVPMALNDAEVF